VLRGHSGLEALGGGSFEEVVRPPLGNCSIHTHRLPGGLRKERVFRYELCVLDCGADLGTWHFAHFLCESSPLQLRTLVRASKARKATNE
jgi:hypothetical protein